MKTYEQRVAECRSDDDVARQIKILKDNIRDLRRQQIRSITLNAKIELNEKITHQEKVLRKFRQNVFELEDHFRIQEEASELDYISVRHTDIQPEIICGMVALIEPTTGGNKRITLRTFNDSYVATFTNDPHWLYISLSKHPAAYPAALPTP